MRTDMTAAFAAAIADDFRQPRQLLVFKFPFAGNVYVSDQALGPADGLAATYLPLVESWGELADTAGDATTLDAGETRQASIVLWNGGSSPFSDYFQAEDPENVEVELYQWFIGLTDADKLLIDRFVVADPIAFGEASRLLNLDLVSLTIRYDQTCGDLLTAADWPLAHTEDIGKGIPQVFGTAANVPALRARVAQMLTLKGSHRGGNWGDVGIYVYEDLDALGLPASGSLQIEDEVVTYSSRSAVGFNLTATLDVDHLDRSMVAEIITNHTFNLCEGPVGAITNVLVAGTAAVAGTYTAYPNLNPARIVFSSLPRTVRPAEGTRFMAINFDTFGDDVTDGTASAQSRSRDEEDLGSAAMLSLGQQTCSAKQTTTYAAPGPGEIVKAYLMIEFYTAPHADFGIVDAGFVKLSGYTSPTYIGQLAFPAAPAPPKGTLKDGSHEHSRAVGDEHLHEYIVPTAENPGGNQTLAQQSMMSMFDITDKVAGNWSWFNNRQASVYYYQPGTNLLYILNMFFDVEYVPNETVYSDQVSATVVSLSTLTGPDQVARHLLTTRAGVVTADIDDTVFTAAGAKYTAAGYALNGLIAAETIVKDALASICRQVHSRLFPSGGKLKLVLREGHPATKPVAKALTTADLQLKSLTAARQPLTDIANRIELFYNRDWSDGGDSYQASVTRESAASISQFGLKTDADAFKFDLITSAVMAGKVADFYLSERAWPSTFYTFTAYLPQFDLEKEDVVTVTASFNNMIALPMVVRAVDRVFGSGKTGAINLLRITAENLYGALNYRLEDQSGLTDPGPVFLQPGVYGFGQGPFGQFGFGGLAPWTEE